MKENIKIASYFFGNLMPDKLTCEFASASTSTPDACVMSIC